MALRQGTGAGWGYEPISISEILAYCELRGLRDPDTRERIRSGVMALDEALREHHGKTGTGT